MPRFTPTSRFDGLDYEAFGDMLRSRPWEIFRQRVLQALEQTLSDCEREDNDLKLRRAQGQAAALRTVISLPEQILKEMKPKL